MATNEHPRNHLSLRSKLKPCSVSSPHTERWRKLNLSQALDRTLDRVNVLGEDLISGHTGQVYHLLPNLLHSSL